MKEWKSVGSVVSRPEDWVPLSGGKGSFKFGRTMLFLAAGRLGQLQLIRKLELNPYAATLQVGRGPEGKRTRTRTRREEEEEEGGERAKVYQRAEAYECTETRRTET